MPRLDAWECTECRRLGLVVLLRHHPAPLYRPGMQVLMRCPECERRYVVDNPVGAHDYRHSLFRLLPRSP